MSKTFLNKIKVYQNQYKKIGTDLSKEVKNKYFTDDTGAIYFSDSFSIIKLFDTKYNENYQHDLLVCYYGELETILSKTGGKNYGKNNTNQKNTIL